MISTSDFRKGMRIAIDGQPYHIIDFQHVKMGRGGANVRTKIKNIKTGQVLERTFSGGEQFKEPDFADKLMQYMYNDESEWYFMDAKTFDQISIIKDKLGDNIWYLQENHEYHILFFESEPISVDLPPSVVLEVTEAEPAIKGDTVSNVMKGAVVETGLSVKVPMFVKTGDRIKIDTREGKYIERA
ncbi:MAG: elongation factor P [candidate division Zixibacteria bacterium]|nr:elongation factor P [candidate division Zixibacteria bacterium]